MLVVDKAPSTDHFSFSFLPTFTFPSLKNRRGVPHFVETAASEATQRAKNTLGIILQLLMVS